MSAMKQSMEVGIGKMTHPWVVLVVDAANPRLIVADLVAAADADHRARRWVEGVRDVAAQKNPESVGTDAGLSRGEERAGDVDDVAGLRWVRRAVQLHLVRDGADLVVAVVGSHTRMLEDTKHCQRLYSVTALVRAGEKHWCNVPGPRSRRCGRTWRG